MCGICGIAKKNSNVSSQELVAMRDTMIHRGPDGEGIYIDQNIGLGHRRLSIIDLSDQGKQPMSTADNRFWITFNGEIYNYKKLRLQLEKKGIKFNSATDTEVILYMYKEHGPKMLDYFNGMFAFAIWDSKEKSIFLARDRLGIKPLFYYIDDNNFYFASEIKALDRYINKLNINTEKISELLIFRSVAGQDTPYEKIKRLLPGHYMKWEKSGISIKKWWDLSEKVKLNKNKSFDNYTNWFKTAFDKSVQYRLISDTPIGILLSGGIDSTSVASSIFKNGVNNMSSYTVTFEDTNYDESNLVNDISRHFSFKSHQLEIKQIDLLDGLIESIEYNDEPLAHNHEQHFLAISRLAKSNVKVLLAGEGGDELMAGYVRHRPVMYYHYLSKILPVLKLFKKNERIKKLVKLLDLNSEFDFILFNATNILPSDLINLGFEINDNFQFRRDVVNEGKSCYPDELIRQQLYYDIKTHLVSLFDRLDRMTMAASIECRVPFLDHNIVENIGAIPSDVLFSNLLFKNWRGKKLLIDSLGHRFPSSVLKGKKWGFGIPWVDYFRIDKKLRKELKNLPNMDFIKIFNFKKNKLELLISNYFLGDNSSFNLLNQLYITSLWYDIKIK